MWSLCDLRCVSPRLAPIWRLIADVSNLLNDYGVGTSEALEPHEDSGSVSDVMTKDIVALRFTNNVASAIPLTLKMSNVSRDDVANPTPQTQPVLDAFNGVASSWASINITLPSPLGTAPQLSDVAPLTTSGPMAAAQVTIQSPTNGVTLASQTASGDATLVTFAAATCATVKSIDFSFSVTFDDHASAPFTFSIPSTLSC